MINGIGLVCVWVFDQDEAKDFYVDKLGCEVAADMAMDGMRFLLVRAPEQPDVQLILSAPGPPIMDRETAEAVRTLVAKGSLGPGVSSPRIARRRIRSSRRTGSSSSRSRRSASTGPTPLSGIRSATTGGSPR